MSRSSTVVAAGTVIPRTNAISARSGGQDDLAAGAEVIAEAEAILVDAMFEEIVRELRVNRSIGSVFHLERNLPDVIVDRDCDGRRVAPVRTVQTSVRAPPATNRF